MGLALTARYDGSPPSAGASAHSSADRGQAANSQRWRERVHIRPTADYPPAMASTTEAGKELFLSPKTVERYIPTAK